jgi:hypothetical protein
MSPLTRLSSILDQDCTSVPIVSGSTLTKLLRSSSIEDSRNMLARVCRETVPAQTILDMHTTDCDRYDLTTIKVPIYVHVNIQDSLVDGFHTSDLVRRLLAKGDDGGTGDVRKRSVSRSCIRYMHGDHLASETCSATRLGVYNDAFQWCRSVVHMASIQTYKTDLYDLGTAQTQSTPLPPNGTKRMDTSNECRLVLRPASLVGYVGCAIGYLSTGILPIWSAFRFHHYVVWSQRILSPLHTSGFPTVALCLQDCLYDTRFCLHLVEYDRFGFGHQLCQKYVTIRNSSTKKHLVVRMPMIAAKVTVGHRLVLSITNYNFRDFLYVVKAQNMSIVFETMSLPYLFDY